LGVAAYLVKPISQSELFDAITRVLSPHVPRKRRPQLVTRHSLRETHCGVRLLLAEDNPVNQILAVRMLEKRGFSITVADSGKKALRTLESAAPGEYALALMDVQMPEMDGFEVTAAIREREKNTGEHMPIVALTAHAMKGDRERCIEKGMDGYVSKPIRAEQLFGVIEKLLPISTAGHGASTGKRGAPAGGGGEDVLNENEVLSRVDGDTQLLKEVSALFFDEYPKLLTEIREAISSRDAKTLKKGAHTLKGMLANLGATPAPRAAFRLEEIGQTGELSNAEQAYASLENEVERFARALTTLVEQSAA